MNNDGLHLHSTIAYRSVTFMGNISLSEMIYYCDNNARLWHYKCIS